jgi:hypothetical protein
MELSAFRMLERADDDSNWLLDSMFPAAWSEGDFSKGVWSGYVEGLLRVATL